MSTDVAVTHDEATHRFELSVDGRTAELDYRLRDGVMVITHTGVPTALEGRGIGSRLVAAAVEFARTEQLTVDPQCWFAARWLERHPAEAAIVTR